MVSDRRRSAAGELVAGSRSRQRPPWSQEFLAEELSRRGRQTSRNQIARLELSLPGRCDLRLFAAAAIALGIERDGVVSAVAADVMVIHDHEADTLGRLHQ